MKAVGTLLLFVILTTGCVPGLAAQQNSSGEEIAALVSQLSWDSVGGECNGIWRISPAGEVAEKLVQIGEPATDELLNVLEDEDKGAAAHLILSEIWESETIVYGSRVEGDKFIHIYNGLEWADIINMEEVSIKHKVERFNLIINAAAWRVKVDKYRRNASRRCRA